LGSHTDGNLSEMSTVIGTLKNKVCQQIQE
jgi:hypothetical protein